MIEPAPAIWSPDLSRLSGPRYRAIAAALHDDIVQGRLPPGTRLPTHRDLAWRLKVTVGTVTRAYLEAERQGLVVGEVGRGTFVRDPERLPEMPLAVRAGDGTIDLSVNASAIGGDVPDLRAAMEAAAKRDDLAMLMGYTPPTGGDRVSRAAAAWIAETAGLDMPAERILAAPGGQGAMHAAFAAVTRPGDTILVEQLTYPGVKPLAALMGLRLMPVALDRDGLIPEAVEREAALHGAKALYCMPTLQNPTTASMPLARREALVAVARRVGLTLIEDDVYGFLAPDAPATLASLGPDVTIYVTSLSKSLFPGLRAGFLIPPAPLAAKAVNALRASILTGSHLGATVAAELIESGAAARIMERRRATVAERQRVARTVLGATPAGSDPAATHLWLTLPEPWRREDFARVLLERGVKVTPADMFSVARGTLPHAVRICLCGAERAETLEAGLIQVESLLREPASAAVALV